MNFDSEISRVECTTFSIYLAIKQHFPFSKMTTNSLNQTQEILLHKTWFSLPKQSQKIEPSYKPDSEFWNTKSLDLSYKMNLDFWDCFRRETPVLYPEEIW